MLGSVILKCAPQPLFYFNIICFRIPFVFYFCYFLSFKPRTLKYSAAARASTVSPAMVVTVGFLALLRPAVEGDPPGGSLTSHTGTRCWPGCWRTALEATPKPSWLPVSGKLELVLCWGWYSASEKGPWPPISARVLYSVDDGSKASGYGLGWRAWCMSNFLLLPQPCLLHTLATVRPWARWDTHPMPRTSSTSHG